jgi:hypothetical protein
MFLGIFSLWDAGVIDDDVSPVVRSSDIRRLLTRVRAKVFANLTGIDDVESLNCSEDGPARSYDGDFALRNDT